MNYKTIIPLAGYIALVGCGPTPSKPPVLNPESVKLCTQPLSHVQSLRFGVTYQILNGLKVCVKKDDSPVLVDENFGIHLEGHEAIMRFSTCFDRILQGELSKLEANASSHEQVLGLLAIALNGTVRIQCLKIVVSR